MARPSCGWQVDPSFGLGGRSFFALGFTFPSWCWPFRPSFSWLGWPFPLGGLELALPSWDWSCPFLLWLGGLECPTFLGMGWPFFLVVGDGPFFLGLRLALPLGWEWPLSCSFLGVAMGSFFLSDGVRPSFMALGLVFWPVLLGVGLALSLRDWGSSFWSGGWRFLLEIGLTLFFLGLGGWPFLLGRPFLGLALPSRSYCSPFLLGVVVGTSFMEWNWSFLHWFGLASLGWPFQGMALPSRGLSWPFLFGWCQLAPSTFGLELALRARD